MKWYKAVQAIAVAGGVFAGTANAQTLTGSVAGSGMLSPTGVVTPPACDIALMPVTGRSCTFVNFGIGTGASAFVNGTATHSFNAGLNAWVYQLTFSFSGAVTGGPRNIQFAFDVPIYGRMWGHGSSTASVTVSRASGGTTTLVDGAPVGPVIQVATFNGVTQNGLASLNLQPGASVISLGSAASNTDTKNSGDQPAGIFFDRTRVSFGFDVTSTGLTPESYSGSGSVIFTSTVVPEPSTYALMAAGLVGLFAAARRRRTV